MSRQSVSPSGITAAYNSPGFLLERVASGGKEKGRRANPPVGRRLRIPDRPAVRAMQSQSRGVCLLIWTAALALAYKTHYYGAVVLTTNSEARIRSALKRLPSELAKCGQSQLTMQECCVCRRRDFLSTAVSNSASNNCVVDGYSTHHACDQANACTVFAALHTVKN